MREAQEHDAFDRHLASLPKLPCGCSVGTRCDGAHARRPAKHGDSAKLSVADAHQLRILKDTVRNPLKGQFLGGPSAEEAEETLRSKFRFTSEQIRNLKGEARHGDMSSRRTRLDLVLDQVKRGDREVTIDTDGYTRQQVDRIIATAKQRGLHAAYDGRFVLVRDLRNTARGRASEGRIEIRGTQSPAYSRGESNDHSVKWAADVRDANGTHIDGAAALSLPEVEAWAAKQYPGWPVTLVRPLSRDARRRFGDARGGTSYKDETGKNFHVGQDVEMTAWNVAPSYGHVAGFEDGYVMVNWTNVAGKRVTGTPVITGASPSHLRIVARGYAGTPIGGKAAR
jgi:hypothetical protein